MNTLQVICMTVRKDLQNESRKHSLSFPAQPSRMQEPTGTGRAINGSKLVSDDIDRPVKVHCLRAKHVEEMRG